MPAQACLLSRQYLVLSFAEENAGKIKFTLQPGVGSPSFATCTHADETPGAEDRKINVEAAAVSSFLPYSAVVTRAGPWGSRSCSGAAGAALRLRAAPSWYEAPQPKPCSSPVMVQTSGDAAVRPQVWFPHMKVKKGRSLVALSAIPMTTNKLVQSRNRCAVKRGSFLPPPKETGREQSTNQTRFSSCFPYQAVQAWPVAQDTLQSCFLAPWDSLSFPAIDFERSLVNIDQWDRLHIRRPTHC